MQSRAQNQELFFGGISYTNLDETLAFADHKRSEVKWKEGPTIILCLFEEINTLLTSRVTEQEQRRGMIHARRLQRHDCWCWSDPRFKCCGYRVMNQKDILVQLRNLRKNCNDSLCSKFLDLVDDSLPTD
jgi:hypothetical protein